MKNLFIITMLMASFGLNTAFAQSCSHAKAKSTTSVEETKKSCSSTALSEEEKAMAIKLAASNDDIETSVCEKSGNVSFAKISKCNSSGAESRTAVQFDSEKKQFVNASPSEGATSLQTSSSADSEEAKKSCSRAEKSKACASKASAGKACCKSKKAAAKASKEEN